MKNPEISVVMSAYNAEKYISEAIESILTQTFKNFEFIIFEDGSADKTKEIIKRYAKKDKRIIPIYNKENIGYKGFIRNLNLGIRMARGKYIARMDADDISLPERLMIQHRYLENNPKIFLLGSGAFIIDEMGKVIKKFNPITKAYLIKIALSIKNCIYHPTIMFRKEGSIFYDESRLYAEDYDFYLRLLSKEKIIKNLKEKLLKYRIVNTSITRKNRLAQVSTAREARKMYWRKLFHNKLKYLSILQVY